MPLGDLIPLQIGKFVLTLGFCARLSAQLAGTITPVQKSYAVGEPIDLVLTINNPTSNDEDFSPRPTFRSISEKGIQVSIRGESPTTHPRFIACPWWEPPKDTVAEPFTIAIKWREPLLRAKPGATTLTLFLQELYGDLSPGTHHVEYSIGIDTIPTHSFGSKLIHGTLTGQGVFDIVVYPASEESLRAALPRHLNSKPPDTSGYWAQRPHQHRFFLIQSPIVIQYITRLPGLEAYDARVLAMIKFKANREAENFVLDQLNTNDTGKIVAALFVLQEWKYVLPEAEVARLLNKGQTEPRLAALRYVYNLPGHAFLPEVRALNHDPDSSVAAASKRIQETLIHRE